MPWSTPTTSTASPPPCTSGRARPPGSCSPAPSPRGPPTPGTPTCSAPWATPAPASRSTRQGRRSWPWPRSLEQQAPALMKPNGEELASLTGGDAELIEADPAAAATAAEVLVSRGVGAVLATLGGSGAVLVTADGAWHATPPPTTVVSTVGAGDSSLFGYLLGDAARPRTRRATAPRGRLRQRRRRPARYDDPAPRPHPTGPRRGPRARPCPPCSPPGRPHRELRKR